MQEPSINEKVSTWWNIIISKDKRVPLIIAIKREQRVTGDVKRAYVVGIK